MGEWRYEPAKPESRNVGSGWFLSGLLLLFIGLKLTGHIDWSWWWVLAPAWVPAGAAVIFLSWTVITLWDWEDQH